MFLDANLLPYVVWKLVPAYHLRWYRFSSPILEQRKCNSSPSKSRRCHQELVLVGLTISAQTTANLSKIFFLTLMLPRKLAKRSPIWKLLPTSTLNCVVSLGYGLLIKKIHLGDIGSNVSSNLLDYTQPWPLGVLQEISTSSSQFN